MTGNSSHEDEEFVLASAIEALAGGKAVKDILILPYGNPIQGRDGRGPWILRDKAQAEKVIAATTAFLGNSDLMVDYDHQSYHTTELEVGAQAKASGWIGELRAADDGIRASVEWTPAADEAIVAREYRYISPYFRVDRKTREITRVVTVALTNTPNLDLPALASRRASSAGEDHDMTKITLAAAAVAAALGIPADGLDEAKVLAQIGQLAKDRSDSEAALASVRTELKLADDAGTEAVLASIKSAADANRPDPAKFVPKAGYDELAARVASLEEGKVLAMVDAACEAGKIAPSMREWAIDLGKGDEAALATYIEKAPAFDGNKPKIDGGAVKPVADKLTDDEKAVCATMGWSEDEFLDQKQKDAA